MTLDEPVASVIIPAHDEENLIARLLSRLAPAAAAGMLDVVVVPNGCRDHTAEVARRTAPAATVVEVEAAGKYAAMRRGDEVARTSPRIYVDADVDISADSLLRLAGAVGSCGVLAAGPARILATESSPWVVRAYYRLWERLPHVREGLFGRGAIAVSEEGLRRLAALPEVMSDDLAVSEAFDARERVVLADVSVVIQAPRSVRDLIRRRVRVATGNAQFDRDVHGGRPTTSLNSVAALVSSDPRCILDALVFIAVSAVARLKARRRVRVGDYATWERDESSRAPEY